MEHELDRTQRLLAAAKCGEREAREELFGRHRDALARRVARELPAELARRVDASDLVQEALVDALENLDGFEDRGPRSFRNWLRAILDNRLRMAWDFHVARARRSTRQESSFARLADRAGSVAGGEPPVADFRVPSPSQACAGAEAELRIRSALAELEPDHRRAIELLRIEGRSVAEAARLLGRSENAVKKLFARALLALAQRLDAPR